MAHLLRHPAPLNPLEYARFENITSVIA